MARRPEALPPDLARSTEVVAGDVLDRASLDRAMQGVEVAYYLIHSMSAREDFARTDREGARNFAAAAAAAGVRRIVYLGGLGRAGEDLSPHLESRHEVGRILREGSVPVVEFRSSIILGSGSLSFELIRALVDRLPVMTTPRWVSVRTQPISIEDVLDYLVQAAAIPLEDRSVVFEIGGPDRVSYADIMREYARQRGLTRRIIPLPMLSPRLSSLWLGLVTPIYARIGRELIDGVRNETVVENPLPPGLFRVRPRGLAAAIRRALVNEDRDFAETRWCDALSSGSTSGSWGGEVRGSRIVDSRATWAPVPTRQAFTPIRRIGGSRGWYAGNWLWRLRGAIDLAVGGVGLRRGRRDPENLRVGEPLDFWRVERFEPDRLLRLQAEMRLPGRAWLQFEVEPKDGGSTIRQTALFKPRGLFGLLYWYGLYPVHAVMFRVMLRRIASLAREAEVALGDLERPEVRDPREGGGRPVR